MSDTARHNSRSILSFLGLVYLSNLIYLGLVLRFNFLRSDVLGYWNDSLDWMHPFNPYHVAGYPLVLALGRGLSFENLSPLVLMIGISFAAFLVSALLVYKLIREDGDEAGAVAGMALFGVWPFIGVVYSVYPVSDSLAVMLFLGGLYALRRSRFLFAGALLGMALIVHKAMWPFVGTLIAVQLFRVPGLRSWRFLVPLVLPLGTLWLLGSLYYGSAWWIVASHVRVEVVAKGALPFLDGIVGTALAEGMKGIVKTGIVVAIASLATVVMLICLRSSTPGARPGAAIALSVLLLAVILNRWEIWAAVRFSKLLVLPCIWCMRDFRPRIFADERLWAGTLTALVASQFVYAWYIARVFYA